jgi:hypothetical protein
MTETSTESSVSPYLLLPLEGPYEIAIGSALIHLAEPNEGHDWEYNRWYEDEHMPAARALPWRLGARRWVAPVDLQVLRYPGDSMLAQPLSAGKYLSVYFVTAGRYQDVHNWGLAKNQRDRAEGRYYSNFTHVYTSYPAYAGVVYRDKRGPRDIHALEHPYKGVVLEIVKPTDNRDALIRWLRDEYLPTRLAESPVAMTLLFEPNPMLAQHPMRLQQRTEEIERLVTLLSFSEVRPPAGWGTVFAGAGEAIRASGLGHVELAAPFYPTLPGTDTYVNELR